MLTTFLNTLATIISVTSLLIVTYGALIGIISFLINEFKRFTGKYSTTNIRKLRATLNELAILGGIVVLRTILSVFLNREIKDLEAESEKDQ